MTAFPLSLRVKRYEAGRGFGDIVASVLVAPEPVCARSVFKASLFDTYLNDSTSGIPAMLASSCLRASALTESFKKTLIAVDDPGGTGVELPEATVPPPVEEHAASKAAVPTSVASVNAINVNQPARFISTPGAVWLWLLAHSRAQNLEGILPYTIVVVWLLCIHSFRGK